MERLEKRGQGLENFKKYNFVFYIIILFITILATFPFIEEIFMLEMILHLIMQG